MREVADRNLLLGPDVVDAEPLPLFHDAEQRPGEIVDVDEGARLLAGPLDRKVDDAVRLPLGAFLHAQDELRNHVLAPHVRAVHVVRPKDQRAVQVLASVVHRQQFADNLAATVREARVQDIGHHERRAFVCRDDRRRLVDLGARRQHESAHALGDARVEHVHHPLDGNLEDQIRPGIEELGAVDIGEMAHALDATYGIPDHRRVPDVPGDALDLVLGPTELRGRAAGIVVERTHHGTRLEQPLDQRAADEAGPPGYEDLLSLQVGAPSPSAGV